MGLDGKGIPGCKIGTARQPGHDQRTDGHEEQARHLGDRQWTEEAVVLGPEDLDDEAFGAGAEQVDPENPADRAGLQSQAPEQGKDGQHQHHLIELGGVNGEDGRGVDPGRHRDAELLLHVAGGDGGSPGET